MKRLELLVMALVTLAALCLCFTPAQGQTVAADITPASTGYSLGKDSQRWNAYVQNLNVKGTFTLNGAVFNGNSLLSIDGMPIGATTLSANCSLVWLEKDARCYGAKGDNATDNVAAFNAWFAALAATPGSLGVLPAGKYKVNSTSGAPTLTSATNVTITAHGAEIYQTATTGNHVRTIVISSSTGVRWYGGKIVGSGDYTGTSQYTALASNLLVLNSTDVTIQGTRQENFGYAGILTSNSNSVHIKDNTIVGPGSTTAGGLVPPGGNYNFGIALQTSDAAMATPPTTFNYGNEITGNTVSNAGTGILIGTPYREGTYSNNVVRNAIGQHGMYIDGLGNSIIANNTIIDPYLNGIKSNPDVTGANVIFSGNNISVSAGANLGVDAAGDNLGAVYPPGGACLLITQSNAGVSGRWANVTVQGGSYSGCNGYGIYAQIVDGLQITGVSVANVTGPGIQTFNFTKAAIYGNKIDSTTQAAIIAQPMLDGRVDVYANTISNVNTVLKAVALQDSAISLAPYVGGQAMTARVATNVVTAGAGTPNYAVYVTGTGIAGTTITSNNDFGALGVSDARSLAPTVALSDLIAPTADLTVNDGGHVFQFTNTGRWAFGSNAPTTHKFTLSSNSLPHLGWGTQSANTPTIYGELDTATNTAIMRGRSGYDLKLQANGSSGPALTIDHTSGNATLAGGGAFVGPLTGNVTGNVTGTAASVTGVVALAQGGTANTIGGLLRLAGRCSGALTNSVTTAPSGLGMASGSGACSTVISAANSARYAAETGVACSISAFSCYSFQAGHSGSDGVCQMYVNGSAASGATCTLGTDVSKRCTWSGTPVVIAAADKVSFLVTPDSATTLDSVGVTAICQ